ncbi:MAG: hypothetical protein Hals2KO_39480 [Halioglobus sp.]
MHAKTARHAAADSIAHFSTAHVQSRVAAGQNQAALGTERAIRMLLETQVQCALSNTDIRLDMYRLAPGCGLEQTLVPDRLPKAAAVLGWE